MNREYAVGTRAIHVGRPVKYPGAPINVSPGFSSTYNSGSTAVYSRDDQEIIAALEEVVGSLEGGTAVAFASGMASIAAGFDVLAAILHRTPKVLVSGSSYFGTIMQLRHRRENFGWTIIESRAKNTASFLREIDGVDVVWLETPSNPELLVFDIAAVAKRARAANAVLCVDNTFATPYLQNPLMLGADIVVHSATKSLSGHSDVLGGLLIAKDQRIVAKVREIRSFYGGILGSMEAFLILRGIRTLHLRMDRASSNAAVLSAVIQSHPKVLEVHYPFLASNPEVEIAKKQMKSGGSLFCFRVGGSAYAADRLTKSLKLAFSATSLGGVETQIDRRARYKGETVPEDFLRVSVGIEDVEDLVDDFTQALEHI